ncbi:MAG: SpoIIIAH-like family protein, partial [Bacilli bacterium]
MKLKKQTVWLLTMLSLVVVLSVYYISSPSMNSNPLTFDFGTEQETNAPVNEAEKPKSTETEKPAKSNEETKEKAQSTGKISDFFAQMRLQLEDTRSVQKEEFESIVASGTATVEDKNRAFDEISKMNDISAKEVLLETMIKQMGYNDAFVRA